MDSHDFYTIKPLCVARLYVLKNSKSFRFGHYFGENFQLAHAEHVLNIFWGELGKKNKNYDWFCSLCKLQIRFFMFVLFWYSLFTIKNSKNYGL